MSVLHEGLANALALSLREVLPLGFSVQSRGFAIVISRSQSKVMTADLTVSEFANNGLPPQMRVRQAVKRVLIAVQECIVFELGVPWPRKSQSPTRIAGTRSEEIKGEVGPVIGFRSNLASSARPHVLADDGTLFMWFGEEDEETQALRLRPIALNEIIEPEPLANLRAETPVSSEKLARAIARRLQSILPFGLEVRADCGDIALFRDRQWIWTGGMAAIISASDDRLPTTKVWTAIVNSIDRLQQLIIAEVHSPWPAEAPTAQPGPDLASLSDIMVSSPTLEGIHDRMRFLQASARLQVVVTESSVDFWFGEEDRRVVEFDEIGPEEYLKES